MRLFSWLKDRGTAARRSERAVTKPMLDMLEDRFMLSGNPPVLFLGDSILAFYANGAGVVPWQTSIAPLGAQDLAVVGNQTEQIVQQVDRGALDGLTPQVIVLL